MSDTMDELNSFFYQEDITTTDLQTSGDTQATINQFSSLFSFKKESKLKEYIHKITASSKVIYSLTEIIIILLNNILQGQMYDESNISIIICTDELEETLGVKIFHISQVRKLVLAHLEELSGEEEDKYQNSQYNHNFSPIQLGDTIPTISDFLGQVKKLDVFQKKPQIPGVLSNHPYYIY